MCPTDGRGFSPSRKSVCDLMEQIESESYGVRRLKVVDRYQALQQFFQTVGLIDAKYKQYFEQAFVEKVQVSPKRRTWKIFLHTPELVPLDIWSSVQETVKKYFAKVCDVFVQFQYDRVDTQMVMELYWNWIRKQIQENLSHSQAGWLGQASWKVEEQRLKIRFPNQVLLDMAQQKKVDEWVAKYYQQLTGRGIHVQLEVKNGASQESNDFLEKKQAEEKQLINQALVQQKKRAAVEQPSKKKKSIGVEIEDKPIPINDITEEERRVTIQGRVFKKEERELKSGRILYTFYVTDHTNSIAAKVFAQNKEDIAVCKEIDTGMWLKIRGAVQFDSFLRDLAVIVRDLQQIEPVERKDTAKEKRVELHLHTAMSAMDGIYGFAKESVLKFEDLVKQAKKWGHPALAITDHGVLQGFPQAYEIAHKHDFKLILGMEAYVIDDGVPIVMRPTDQDILKGEYVVFDVETTGLSVTHDVIIELAAVKIKDGEIVDRFESFANPHRPLTAQIRELTGITDDMVKDAPEVDQVIRDFLAFIEGSILVAHNARFDMGFLQEAVKRLGKSPVTNPVVDTLELARYLYPDLKNHRLNTLCEHLNVSLKQHHRAIYDAEATGYVLWKMIQEAANRGFEKLLQLNEETKDRNLNRLRPFHVSILVKNRTGLRNLYQLVSKSHIEYFYRVPRIPRSELEKYREGLIIGSGCEKGELFEAALNKSEQEVEKIAEFYDYLEIQPVEVNQHLIDRGLVESAERLRDANRTLVAVGDRLGKPVVATGNVHYLNREDAIYREIVAYNQSGGPKPQGPLPLTYFRTTDEMLDEFQYLGEEKAYEVVVTNSRMIADQVERVNPFPEGTYAPKIEGAEEELRRICYENAHELYGDPLPDLIKDRLETELNGIINNGYAVIYMISHKLVTKSLDDGYLVGSRGSVGSSFVATMSKVSEVNPLPPHYLCKDCHELEFVTDGSVETGFDLPDKDCPSCGKPMTKDGHDLPFATFLGFEGDKTPDIDLNFASDYQARCHAYTEELLGKESVFRAGSVGTIKEKTAFGFVKKYAEEKGITYRQAEIERLAQGCIGVKRSTGQHPGGLMVVPQDMDVHDFTPIQRPANNMKSNVTTTHFDYDAISGKILKLDLLGHTAPAMLRMLQDMTGVDPREIPTNDSKVIELFRSTRSLGITPEQIGGVSLGTLGIPEFGTSFAQGILEETRPTTIGEFTRVSGLSHGTDVWAGNARELIRNGICTLREAICNRDDIMLYLIRKGLKPKKAFEIMERVRKGKGLSEEQEQMMRDHGVPDWYIESCKKIKYMFPRAHAAAYVISAIWIAWYKVYYPAEFYAAYFSKSLKDCDIEIMLKGYDYVSKQIEMIREKGYQASTKEQQLLTVLELTQEMYARNIKFRPIDLYQSDATNFRVIEGELLPPFASIAGVGESAAKNIVKAREEGEFLSITDLQKRSRISSTVIESLERLGCLQGLPMSNQLSLFM